MLTALHFPNNVLTEAYTALSHFALSGGAGAACAAQTSEGA